MLYISIFSILYLSYTSWKDCLALNVDKAYTIMLETQQATHFLLEQMQVRTHHPYTCPVPKYQSQRNTVLTNTSTCPERNAPG